MKSSNPFHNFIWFQGVVEDVNDPKKAGRVRVRCIGFHTEDRGLLPTANLPLASFMNGTAAMGAPLVLPGDWVMGFFLDGEEAQMPVIIGSLVGIPVEKKPEFGFFDPEGIHPRELEKPTNSPSARGETKVADYKSQTAWQNPTAFGARYPFNHVMETDKGSMFELDDTDGSERVCIFYHKGSYVEFLPDGTVVVKSVKDRWDVTFGNGTMLVNGDLTIGATGNVNIAAGGDLKLSAAGTLDIASGGDLNLGAGGSSTHMASGAIRMNGASFDWGFGSDVTGGPDPVDGPGDTSQFKKW